MYEIKTKGQLESFIAHHWNEVNKYLNSIQDKLPIPIYSSVDIRESKDKFAPVDHNMYPAGFNNLCGLDLGQTSQHFAHFIHEISPQIETVGIIPESHTKNTFYLEHLYFLKKCIEDAGFKVVVVSLDSSIFSENEDMIQLQSVSGYPLKIFKGIVDSGNIVLKSPDSFNFKAPQFILLNHDQSTPLDVNWNDIKTPVYPTPQIGWFQREKIKHFIHYAEVAHKFSEYFSIDPALLQAKFRFVRKIDFSKKEGLEELAQEVDLLLKELPPESKVFVKASQGTYGMGISVVSSAEEIQQMNRKIRNKMDIGKNRIKFTSVLIQEGIETVLKYDNMPAEVTIYQVGGQSVGGFMRANPLRSAGENLNAKGMVFHKFCISEIRQDNEHKVKEAVYSIIARLSTIASSYEIKEVLDSTEK